MKIEFTGRNIRVSDKLRQIATDRLDKLTKFVDASAEAHVVLTVEKRRHTAEIVLMGKQESLSSHVETDDIQASLALVLDKIERQAKKHRSKLIDTRRRTRAGSVPTADTPENLEREPTPTVVEAQAFNPSVMSVEDAVMKLDTGEDPCVLFLDTVSGKLNVLFRRSDEHFTLLEPQY